jgi:hypothetical protein
MISGRGEIGLKRFGWRNEDKADGDWGESGEKEYIDLSWEGEEEIQREKEERKEDEEKR